MAVGIDLGVARFAALSDGTFVEGANAFKKHEKRLAFLQRRLARKVKFSTNWRRAKARITDLCSRIANVRKDALHKASATISKNHAIAVMEDLRMANMTKSAAGTVEAPGTNVRAKSALNRRILDQGWGEFRRQLEYKLARKGGTLLLVRSPRHEPHVRRLRRGQRGQSAHASGVCLRCMRACCSCRHERRTKHFKKGGMRPDRLWRRFIGGVAEARSAVRRVSGAPQNPRPLGRGAHQVAGVPEGVPPRLPAAIDRATARSGTILRIVRKPVTSKIRPSGLPFGTTTTRSPSRRR